MEYQPVKFIIKCFEANYPESLGQLLIHNAPWIFSGIWRLIHGWMDPVVASKVHFTRSVNDLDKYISRDQIPRELAGDEDWQYEYIQPEDKENEIMQDTAKRDSLMYERMMIGLRMFAATAAWISATDYSKGEEDKGKVEELKARRNGIIEEFRRNYWKLDPYIRARALIDRAGVLKGDGTVVVGGGSNGDVESGQRK
ncbi:CRAL-TRIO domain-containing protein C3H8.02 [Penicillium subrubescens]|uniref:CRAL-TRIO domain-containing protein C3H8.02 n=1 Tax=Penicillium subrubescens TaxID=1316194 RepID=A0A1Q5T2L2_9EURO|nr:CRAL-TRIO domain-containing protein C3H8.02 [Penicillium subrubescens]